MKCVEDRKNSYSVQHQFMKKRLRPDIGRYSFTKDPKLGEIKWNNFNQKKSQEMSKEMSDYRKQISHAINKVRPDKI